jgi:hypothetical protein
MRKLILGALLLLSTLGFTQTTENDSIKTLDDYLYKEDKFTGQKEYYSPTSIISIAKFTNNNGYSQYISINVPGSTLNYGCYGVSILFENGKKIVRPNEKVDTSYSDGWVYKAFFKPTLNEINLLKSYKVVAVKLYIYDSDIDSIESETFLTSAKVMLTTPKPKKKK